MPPKKEAPAVNEKAVIAHIKKGDSSAAAAAALKVSPSVMAGLYYKLEPVADPKLKFSGTAKQIVSAREDGMRWERIAARTGKSVSEVQKLYEEGSGQKYNKSYTGRGRRFDGSKPAAKAASDNGGKKASTARGGAKKGGGKARTRAQRAAKASASPS